MARLVVQLWRLRHEDDVIATVTSINFANTCVLEDSGIDGRRSAARRYEAPDKSDYFRLWKILVDVLDVGLIFGQY